MDYGYGLIPVISNITNSGSKAMNVNGSSVNQTFSYSPGGSLVVAINKISCILRQGAGDNTSFTNFAAISALTNGILVQCSINGSTSTIATIKDNSDLCHKFHFNQFGNSSVLSILSIVTSEGFGNTSNAFIGTMELVQPLVLVGSDSISVLIQDNLSSVGLLNMSIVGTILV